MEDEKKIASASYIMNFAADIDSMIWQSANYINLLAKFKKKYPEKDIKADIIEMDSEDQYSLNVTLQNLRAEIFRSYLRYKALKKEIKDLAANEKDEKEIEEIYKKLLAQDVMNQDELEKYLTIINGIFVSGIGGELLQKSKDMLSKMTA